MNLLLIVCASERSGEVVEIIDQHKVHTFTEIDDVRGSGETGRHLGTRAFPGASSLIFTVVDEEKAEELIAALRDFAARCEPGEGLSVFEMDVKELI